MGTEKGVNFFVLSFKKFKSLFAVLKNMLKDPYFVVVSLKNKNKQVKIFQTYKYQCCAKNKQNLTFDNQFMDDYYY